MRQWMRWCDPSSILARIINCATGKEKHVATFSVSVVHPFSMRGSSHSARIGKELNRAKEFYPLIRHR